MNTNTITISRCIDVAGVRDLYNRDTVNLLLTVPCAKLYRCPSGPKPKFSALMISGNCAGRQKPGSQTHALAEGRRETAKADCKRLHISKGAPGHTDACKLRIMLEERQTHVRIMHEYYI